MKIKSGNDEIDIGEISISQLKEIPIGKCMRQKTKMNLFGDIIEASVTICRTSENKWNITGKTDFGDEENISIDGEIVID